MPTISFLFVNYTIILGRELRQSIAQYSNMTLDVLLRGDERLSTNINSIIFEAVHKYIQKSKRF